MIALLIVIGLILLIFCFVFFTKLRLYAFVSTEKISIYIKFGFIKIPLYPSEAKKPESSSLTDEKTELGITSFRDFWGDNSTDLKNSLVRLKNRVLIERFDFEYNCGFSDAAVTAVMYGVVNGLYCGVFSFLDMHFRIKEMHGRISPDFNSGKKYIALDSVFRLTVTDIIYIAAALLPVIKNIKNYKKGGALNG